MINIAELLKDVTKGMKLYSPLFGEVKFVKVEKQSDYPIVVTDCKGNGKSFTEFGVYFADHPDAECLLLPSKDCRTWEGWKAPVEPNFKVGDWIVRGKGFVYEPSLITEIRDYYICELLNGERVTYTLNDVHKNFHLWTIQDAKDGDVLATDNGWTCIFKAFDGCVFSSYCFMDSQKWFCKVGSEVHTPDSRINGNIHPATKEQRCQLVAKMKEAGYEWDGEKKELKKIQPHYDIANFKAKQWVLVRDCDNQVWGLSMFSHRDMGCYICLNREDFIQCIPFNGNEHLLGTTDMCSEEYLNW